MSRTKVLMMRRVFLLQTYILSSFYALSDPAISSKKEWKIHFKFLSWICRNLYVQISLQYSPLLLRLRRTNNSGPCFEDMDINDLYVLQQKTRLMSVAPPSLIETSKEKKLQCPTLSLITSSGWNSRAISCSLAVYYLKIPPSNCCFSPISLWHGSDRSLFSPAICYILCLIIGSD